MEVVIKKMKWMKKVIENILVAGKKWSKSEIIFNKKIRSLDLKKDHKTNNINAIKIDCNIRVLLNLMHFILT